MSRLDYVIYCRMEFELAIYIQCTWIYYILYIIYIYYIYINYIIYLYICMHMYIIIVDSRFKHRCHEFG